MPLIAAALALATLSGCSVAVAQDTTITDMIGREVSVTPGSYKRVVCVGAGALRMYSYIGDVSLLRVSKISTMIP